MIAWWFQLCRTNFIWPDYWYVLLINIGWKRRRRIRRGRESRDLLSWRRARLITWKMDTDGESMVRKLLKTALFPGNFPISHTHQHVCVRIFNSWCRECVYLCVIAFILMVSNYECIYCGLLPLAYKYNIDWSSSSANFLVQLWKHTHLRFFL